MGIKKIDAESLRQNRASLIEDIIRRAQKKGVGHIDSRIVEASLEVLVDKYKLQQHGDCESLLGCAACAWEDGYNEGFSDATVMEEE